MNEAQRKALANLCARYGVEFVEANYSKPFDLGPGWVAGQVGPIYVGCSPEGNIHS